MEARGISFNILTASLISNRFRGSEYVKFLISIDKILYCPLCELMSVRSVTSFMRTPN